MGKLFVADLAAVEGRIRLPLADDWVRSARRFPEEIQACWTGDAACGPAPLLALRDANQALQWNRTQAVSDGRTGAGDALPGGDFEAPRDEAQGRRSTFTRFA